MNTGIFAELARQEFYRDKVFRLVKKQIGEYKVEIREKTYSEDIDNRYSIYVYKGKKCISLEEQTKQDIEEILEEIKNGDIPL